jgi:hypothetical protein
MPVYPMPNAPCQASPWIAPPPVAIGGVPILLVLFLLASPSLAHDDKRPFGPFTAGGVRPVARQGVVGVPRQPHPMVGSAAQVPGGGPAPPALSRSPDVPETVFERGGGTSNALVGLSANPLYLIHLVYANFLTRTDGPRCQHHPTCSRYASQAVARYGLLGIPMGLDRLIRPAESSAVRHLPEVPFGEMSRAYDPIDDAEWWNPDRFQAFPPATAEQSPVFAPSSTPVAIRTDENAP